MARQKPKVSKPSHVPEGAVALIAPKGMTSLSFPDYEEIAVEDGAVVVPVEHEQDALNHGCTPFPDEDEDE